MDRNSLPSHWRKTLAFILLGIALCLAVTRPAPAQVLGRLPQALPPVLPGVPLLRPVDALAGGVAGEVTGHLDAVTRLLRANPRQLERGLARGEVAVRAQVLALAPSDTALAAAGAAGFTIIADTTDPDLGLRLVTLRPPGNQSIRKALLRLRDLDPGGSYDLNHIFTPGAAATGTILPAPPADTSAIPGARIGLIDSGVATAHPALASARITARGFAGAMTPGAHGTAIASLLVGNSAERGFAAAPGAALFAADVYGAGPTGGNARAIIAAMGWLAQQRPGVVNISLVGPANIALAAGIAALRARGTLVVAAVGNDGPAAMPLYPAAYPGVIAVTGLDNRGRLLPEAGRAAHVEFSAPGIARAADIAGGFKTVRGTSFAAPIVTGRLAHLLPVADPVAAAKLSADGIAGPRR